MSRYIHEVDHLTVSQVSAHRMYDVEKARLLRVAVGLCIAGFGLAGSGLPVRAHDVNTNVTWNREISRIFTARCAACHQPGGQAFALLTFQDALPWAAAIKASVLQRQMPPWGAVKGFGSFRNEQALGQEELDLIRAWVDGGSPEGNPDHLALRPRVPALAAADRRAGAIVVDERYLFDRPFVLDGFVVKDIPAGGGARITVEFPDGRIEPLVWLHDYRPQAAHPFLLRRPVRLPAGARLRGLAGGSLLLLPAGSN
jgi:mono/diheme cytochrome c family protein